MRLPCPHRQPGRGSGRSACAPAPAPFHPEQVKSHMGCACSSSQVPEEPFQQLPLANKRQETLQARGSNRGKSVHPQPGSETRVRVCSQWKQREKAQKAPCGAREPRWGRSNRTLQSQWERGQAGTVGPHQPHTQHGRKRHNCILLLEYERQGAFPLQTQLPGKAGLPKGKGNAERLTINTTLPVCLLRCAWAQAL